jgi:hypothetical protein
MSSGPAGPGSSRLGPSWSSTGITYPFGSTCGGPGAGPCSAGQLDPTHPLLHPPGPTARLLHPTAPPTTPLPNPGCNHPTAPPSESTPPIPCSSHPTAPPSTPPTPWPGRLHPTAPPSTPQGAPKGATCEGSVGTENMGKVLFKADGPPACLFNDLGRGGGRRMAIIMHCICLTDNSRAKLSWATCVGVGNEGSRRSRSCGLHCSW